MSSLKKSFFNLLFSQRFFEFFQRYGINITRNAYNSPIPYTKPLKSDKNFWRIKSELPGINIDLKKQLYFLEKIFSLYKEEYNFPINKTEIPYEYYLNNPHFGLQPAAILHCMIRHFRPKTIIEVGSGHSTYIAARASMMNQKDGYMSKLLSIEPYPDNCLMMGFPGLSGLTKKRVEEIPLDFFSQLDNNDILFIDSSHTIRIGGDVNYLYLEVLPRLKKGVIVHFHDIFLPFNYPKKWIVKKQFFWNEQYLLQSFLCFNNTYETIFSNYYMNQKYPNKMKKIFTVPDGFQEFHFPSSFWIKKSK
jgi:hypothetical protein